jgi:flavorubredoxin
VGVKTLKEIFHDQHDIQPVRDGEALSLGNMDLKFMETRMIHWPDSMFSYLEKDGVLFSQDAFGMHLATFERFADQLPADMLEYEAATYYANIVLPYSRLFSRRWTKLPPQAGRSKYLRRIMDPLAAES